MKDRRRISNETNSQNDEDNETNKGKKKGTERKIQSPPKPNSHGSQYRVARSVFSIFDIKSSIHHQYMMVGDRLSLLFFSFSFHIHTKL